MNMEEVRVWDTEEKKMMYAPLRMTLIPVEVRGIFRGRVIREGEFYLVERR